jgi:hypothetical protein
MPLILQGNTSGQTTIQATDATTQTITLPANSGTVLTSLSTQSQFPANIAGNGPAFSAYNNTSQSIPNNTYTKLQISTKIFDTNSNYDNVTNYRFTPSVAGYYQVNYGTNPSVAASNTLAFVTLYKNGSVIALGSTATNNTGSGIVSIGSFLVSMNGSTDYIELYGYQNSGGALFFNGGPGTTYFQASMVRSA